MAAHRGRSAHQRLLARLDGAVAEAWQFCEYAQNLCPHDPDDAMAEAFQTVLARPTREWMHRAEAIANTVRPGGDTICGTRATQLRVLIDRANVAMMRPANGREAWRWFYNSVLDAQNFGR